MTKCIHTQFFELVYVLNGTAEHILWEERMPLKELNEKGITVLVVTHDEKVASFALRNILVSDGKIVTD